MSKYQKMQELVENPEELELLLKTVGKQLTSRKGWQELDEAVTKSGYHLGVRESERE